MGDPNYWVSWEVGFYSWRQMKFQLGIPGISWWRTEPGARDLELGLLQNTLHNRERFGANPPAFDLHILGQRGKKNTNKMGQRIWSFVMSVGSICWWWAHRDHLEKSMETQLPATWLLSPFLWCLWLPRSWVFMATCSCKHRSNSFEHCWTDILLQKVRFNQFWSLHFSHSMIQA